MNIVAFDVDGTLLDSSNVDSRLYLGSVRTVLGDIKVRGDWSDYEHVTDQGLLRSIIRDNKLTKESELISKVKEVFVRSLSEYLETHGPFKEIPGALDFVRALQKSDNTQIAYATGGWGTSATLKLQTAGFPLEGISLASSDSHDDRISIMRSAVSALSVNAETITYYGDAVWDRVACERLGWRFAAVGKELGGIEAYESAA